MPARALRYSPVMCGTDSRDPPYRIASGFCLASAINSGSVFTPSFGVTTKSIGWSPISPMVAKSVCRSTGSLVLLSGRITNADDTGMYSV
jgi:hypothetical protein